MEPANEEKVASGDAGSKPNVVFVGSFRETAVDGALGGTLFASRSLINSLIGRHVNWVFVDSTCRSVPPPPMPFRILLAARRLLHYVWVVGLPSTDVTLIFAGSHLGFVEKGIMALISKTFGKPVLFSPRSGMMIDALRESRIQRLFVRFVLSRCDRIICQGETWRAFYRDLTQLPLERLISIPNWVKLADYADIRLDLTSHQGPPVFLYLGWIESYKGVFDLIHAVDRVRGDLTDAKVLICGRGAALAEAQRLTEQMSLQHMVHFRGWVLGEEKRNVLAESDVFVLPSHREGLPNALLEAMATGLPVISSRVGAIPDVLEDGRSGILIEPGDVDALGRALVYLARNRSEREKMGKAAQLKIARDHDIDVVWPKVLDTIRQVVKTPQQEKGTRR